MKPLTPIVATEGAAGKTQSFRERFLDKAFPEPMSGCWIWTGARLKSGYGKLLGPGGREGKVLFAHRASYEIHHGPIPPGMCVCHKCDNPTCVNPEHLFVGTAKDNVDDRIRKGRGTPPPPKNWPEIMRNKKHHWQTLTRDQAIQIKKRLSVGGERQKDIAKDYGVTTDTIGKIYRGERWAHV